MPDFLESDDSRTIIKQKLRQYFDGKGSNVTQYSRAARSARMCAGNF